MSTASIEQTYEIWGPKAELLVGKNIDINECRQYSVSDIDICGIVDVKSATELEN